MGFGKAGEVCRGEVDDGCSGAIPEKGMVIGPEVAPADLLVAGDAEAVGLGKASRVEVDGGIRGPEGGIGSEVTDVTDTGGSVDVRVRRRGTGGNSGASGGGGPDDCGRVETFVATGLDVAGDGVGVRSFGRRGVKINGVGGGVR